MFSLSKYEQKKNKKKTRKRHDWRATKRISFCRDRHTCSCFVVFVSPLLLLVHPMAQWPLCVVGRVWRVCHRKWCSAIRELMHTMFFLYFFFCFFSPVQLSIRRLFRLRRQPMFRILLLYFLCMICAFRANASSSSSVNCSDKTGIMHGCTQQCITTTWNSIPH